jgi:hypothetical protein
MAHHLPQPVASDSGDCFDADVDARGAIGWSASSARHRWQRRHSGWFFAPHAVHTRG